MSTFSYPYLFQHRNDLEQQITTDETFREGLEFIVKQLQQRKLDADNVALLSMLGEKLTVYQDKHPDVLRDDHEKARFAAVMTALVRRILDTFR